MCGLRDSSDLLCFLSDESGKLVFDPGVGSGLRLLTCVPDTLASEPAYVLVIWPMEWARDVVADCA